MKKGGSLVETSLTGISLDQTSLNETGSLGSGRANRFHAVGGQTLRSRSRKNHCKPQPTCGTGENFVFPDELGSYQQILLEKNTLDVFDNPNTGTLLSRLAALQKSNAGSRPDFLVFGVVTEHCVQRAADGLLRRGYGVSIVADAIQSLDEKKGREFLGHLQSRGARLITTEQALTLISHDRETAPPVKSQKTSGD